MKWSWTKLNELNEQIQPRRRCLFESAAFNVQIESFAFVIALIQQLG